MKILIDTLQNWDRNPREIDDKHLEALCKYMSKYPSIVRLLVDPRVKKTVLGGNMRLRVAKKLNWTEIEVVYADEVTNDEQAFEVAMIDNNQFGSYIQDKLVDASY